MATAFLAATHSGAAQARLELPGFSLGAPRSLSLAVGRPVGSALGPRSLTVGCEGLFRAERAGSQLSRGAAFGPFLEYRGEQVQLGLSAGVTRAVTARTWRSSESVAVRGATFVRNLRLTLTGRTTFLPPRTWQESSFAQDPDSVWRKPVPITSTRTSRGESSTDGILELRWRGDGWTLGAEGALRFGSTNHASRLSGRLLAERRLAPHLSIIAHAGWSPAALELGLPARHIGGVALKLGWDEPRLPRRPSHLKRTGNDAFSVRTLGGELRSLRLVWPGARRVELSGDFTDWDVVAMTRDGDQWEARLPIANGLHRLSLRVDGGKWLAPPGLVPLTDGFGGTTGTLCLP